MEIASATGVWSSSAWGVSRRWKRRAARRHRITVSGLTTVIAFRIEGKNRYSLRQVFQRYCELGSVRLLKDELNRNGVRSKLRIAKNEVRSGGHSFSRGALFYALLGNPIYVEPGWFIPDRDFSGGVVTENSICVTGRIKSGTLAAHGWVAEAAGVRAALTFQVPRETRSRESDPSPTDQHPGPQAPEARAPNEFGPPAVGLAVPGFPVDPERNRGHQTLNADPLAPPGLSRVLTVEISSARWGRPQLDGEIRDLIRQMSMANPLWGAPRIHGELLMLGIEVAQSTVAKYMAPRTRRPPSQSWKTFLRNHAAGIASIDLFVVPTAFFKLLYGLVILNHDRRLLVGFGVTSHPSAEWIARQVTEAFPWDQAPRYLIRDRDCVYGHAFIRRVRAMGIRDRPTAARSPWQNGHVERLIGSIRRACIDHSVVFGEAYLPRIVRAYAAYYNEVRTHLSLEKNAPVPRTVQRVGQITALPLLGGLYHQYLRI